MTVYTRIGKYEVRRQIGRGAMGTVFEAFDPTIERRVAIKTLRLDVFEESQLADVRTRFKREAQLAGQMSHPHIVTVYDYGEDEGTPYIVMEYMTGSELSKIIEKGTRLPLSEVVRLMIQLLGALTYAHERKVVHRDVKPANIFVLEDGSLKVVDFGIARVEASNLTDTGAMLGTPAYMSPEQFLAMPVDERSDIFSAGVICYELLTGDKPFTGSVTTIMQKVLHQEPVEPSVLNPLISHAWDAVVKRAMAKKPRARFQSARQFSETIKQVSDSRAVQVLIEAPLAPGGGARAASEETLRPETARAVVKTAQAEAKQVKEPTRSAPHRQKWLLGFGAAAVIAAGVWAAVPLSVWQSLFRDAEKQKAEEDRKASELKAAEDRARSAAEKLAQEKIAVEKAAAERANAEKQAIERGVADKLAQIKAQQDKEAADRTAAQLADRIATEKKAAAEKARVAKVEEEKVAQQRAQHEKEAADLATAQKELADRAAAEKKAAEEKVKLANRSASEIALAADDFYNAKRWEDAAREYKAAAELNHPAAQRRLGYLYENGWGVPRDDREALRLYRLAAMQNDSGAQNNIGHFYEQGRGGLTVDYSQAMVWYRKAADQGNATGQNNLGALYGGGRGVVRDREEALRWYRKAAEKDEANALNNLGYYYENGYGGLQKDLNQARYWYQKAADRGSTRAKTNLERLGR